ncbi:MAG: DUF6516 family protein [bacterium]
MEITKSLEKSEVVKRFSIIDFQTFEDGFYIKINAYLVDGSELHVREYSDQQERNYLYHWQSSDRKLIMRWDNASHHKHLITYPHHVHQRGEIMASQDIFCSEVLKVIEEKLSAA